MLEKIGKYRIVEQIGRGSMGLIFKARDPVLGRLVAVKVISTDVEMTDELRARFFREAQACAQLNHPNIVTVYAMGDDDGQLFIVMELLEGEELKQLIAERRTRALEDKLSIMMQVCDGLHYAHQKGIVHRDIKPSNIFLLRSGQVKILDFGIAQMANADDLTRAGSIMGSLRYMAPEQVSGRGDHRSDIFSVGGVFYEFLALRPPFVGEDPLQLLAQLRADEPPPLDQLDPAIPPALAAVVGRAMRKDPAERFPDLARMRSQLEEIQRELTEEGQRLSARIGDQHGRLLELRAALAERTGPPPQDEPVPAINECARLAALQAFERDLSGRMETLQARLTRADSLAPALRRATALLEAGQGADAVGEFEAIVAEMPDHARALDGLARARAQVDDDLRRHAVEETIRQSEPALDSPTALAKVPTEGFNPGAPAPESKRRSKRVALAVLGGLAAIGLGALLLWLPRAPSTVLAPGPSARPGKSASSTAGAAPVAAEGPPAEQSAAGQRDAVSSPSEDRAVSPPVLQQLPRMVDAPVTPRQVLRELLEGRNPGHSVTATAVRDVVGVGRDNVRFTITSSRPGHVYVMVVRGTGSDVELLLLNAVETDNRIEPGRPLTLPSPRWPGKAPGRPGANEFVAMVSDEPRDFSALGPVSGNAFTTFRLGHRRLNREPSSSTPLLAGTVSCASAPGCSESYGAVAFSPYAVQQEAAARRAAPPSPASPPLPTGVRREGSRRCSDILERASLGEPLTDEERTTLTQHCR